MKKLLRWLFGLSFVAAGGNHFLNAGFYLAIMPNYLPWHTELVQISGVAEIVLGILLLVPGCRRLAGWGLIALLIAVFPANLQMTMHPENYPDIPTVALWIRLPFQGVLIALAYWFSRDNSRS